MAGLNRSLWQRRRGTARLSALSPRLVERGFARSFGETYRASFVVTSMDYCRERVIDATDPELN